MLPQRPKKIDFVEKVRLRACDLKPGMFVCELDKPWLETPFLLQGFEIKDDSDIETVMQHSEYVYVDLMRTRIVKDITPEAIKASKLAGKQSTQTSTDLEQAKETHKKTSSLIKSFIDEIRFGHSLDIQLAKGAVSECVSNVLRNPETMIFLTRINSKDSLTSQHAFNSCIYAIVLGRLMGFDTQQLENLGTCTMLHDMGKVVMPDYILQKPGPLNEEETSIMQTHPLEGRNILMSGRNIFSGTVDVAYGHHENLDGTGYPRHLQGHQLNLNCKIATIVDKYDAITSPRPYRPEGDHLRAIAILNKLARDGKIDQNLTSSFVAYLGIYPPGCVVELSSGEVAIVLESNVKQRLRPQLLVVRDPQKQPAQIFVDMSEKTCDERGKPYRIVSVRRPSDYGIDLAQYYDFIMKSFG